MKPQINPTSAKIVEKIIKNLPQALLLYGERGIGLDEIAKYIADQRQATAQIVLPEKDDKIDLEKGTINVEIMRRLYDELRTKSSGDRIIIVDYAERMTVQAQNAFLKLLEEPGADVHFILIATAKTKLLPTILSRTENIQINKITTAQSNELLDDLGVTDKTKRAQLLFIADGLPAELIKLSSDDEYFAGRSDIVRDAREFLRGRVYKKMLIAQKYKDNRPNALILLSDMANMLQSNIINDPKVNAMKLGEKIIGAYRNIEANGNIRLCLAQISL